MAKQFTYKEFWRILTRVTHNDDTYHCNSDTIQLLRNILDTDYPYQEDDIEYLLDVTNYHLRRLQYKGVKQRFPISSYLDLICKDDFYITEFLDRKQESVDAAKT